MGAARGLDEGLIGTTVTQKSFIKGTFTSCDISSRTDNTYNMAWFSQTR